MTLDQPQLTAPQEFNPKASLARAKQLQVNSAIKARDAKGGKTYHNNLLIQIAKRERDQAVASARELFVCVK